MSDQSDSNWQSADETPTEYRSVSALAVLALIAGLAAPLVWVAPLLIAIPAVAIFLGALALRRISASGGVLEGRWAALAGLALGTICIAGFWSQSFMVKHLLAKEASAVAADFFEQLAQDKPLAAMELSLAPAERQPPAVDLTEFYASNSESHQRLQTFVSNPTIRTLLALRDTAQVRLFENVAAIPVSAGRWQLVQTYAVTYPESGNGKPTTWFIKVGFDRRTAKATTAGGWQVVGYEGGIEPGA